MTSQVIAIDYGKKRIGLAIGNTLTRHAQPLETLENLDDEQAIESIVKLITEWQVNQLVMGMPYNPSPETEASKTAKKLKNKIKTFALKLSECSHLPIEFIDESFTSHEAQRLLKHNRQEGLRKKKIQKKDIDKAAASIILQRWFDLY